MLTAADDPNWYDRRLDNSIPLIYAVTNEMSDKLRVLMFTRSVTNVRLLMFGTSVLLPRIAFRLVRVWFDKSTRDFIPAMRTEKLRKHEDVFV